MIDSQIFIQVLAAIWIVGSAIGLGVYQALKDRTSKYVLFGYLWATVFSWAFVGWLAGSFYAQAIKVLVQNIKRCAASRPEGR